MKWTSIVINFLPDIKGSLRIHCSERDEVWNYSFQYPKPKDDSDEWDTLVQLAQGILAQAQRRIEPKIRHES